MTRRRPTAVPASALPRPLPRSLAPQPGETLAGYLLNLSSRLEMRPADLSHRVGLELHPDVRSINVEYAMHVQQDTVTRFGHACHLTPAEIEGLTLARWKDLFGVGNTRAAQTWYGSGWLSRTLTRACPLCLAEPDPAAPDRILWQAAWKTTWAFACARHEVLLEDTCGGCGALLGTSGHRIGGLIPNPTFAPLHPAACRARNGSQGLCGHRIDEQATTLCPQPLLPLQRRLDGLLDGSITQVSSLGVSVPPAQYIRDLRALIVLLQLADHRSVDSALPDSFTTALNRHLDARREKRTNRTANDRTDRTWTAPPTDTRVLAALIHQAVAILDLPTAEDAHDLLPPLVEAANEREERTWSRVRSAAEPSDGLFRYFAPNRAGTFSLHMLRAACPTALNITSDHVPGYLDRQRYQRWFASFSASQQRNIRRAVPIAIVQLIEGCDLRTAGERLGIPSASAQAAIIRAGRACKRTDRDDEFRRLIGLTAEDLQANPIDYGHRRRYLNADWDIPEPDWQRVVEQMLAARIARQDSPLEDHRRSLRIWLWSHITGGDPVLAPMIRPSFDGRHSTAGTISSYTTLRRRAAPALEEIVNRYSLQVIEHIDGTTREQSAAVLDASAAR